MKWAMKKAVQWQEVHRDDESDKRADCSQPKAMQEMKVTFDSMRIPRAIK
jgi:hypothetical protein